MTQTQTVGQSPINIQYKPLHPTFVAEASNVDLTQPTAELVHEIKKGLAKVRLPLHPAVAAALALHASDASPYLDSHTTCKRRAKQLTQQYGVLVFRQTGLTDDTHVALSRLFGELDDVTPYNKLGRINRLKYDE